MEGLGEPQIRRNYCTCPSCASIASWVIIVEMIAGRLADLVLLEVAKLSLHWPARHYSTTWLTVL